MQNLAELEPDALMARAKANTGLDDFGPGHFLEPLTVLTRSMREEADLNEAGIQMQGGRIVNALENRLRRQALMKAHPEIADEKVEVGAIIVGLPRTGSTMLHRMLASAPGMTGTRWFETQNYAPFPNETRGDPEPRREAARGFLD